ncbi:hypothetical protein ACMD2_00024, partial [Ananas comosus]
MNVYLIILFYFLAYLVRTLGVDEAGKTLAIIIGLMAAVALIIVFLSFIRRAGNEEGKRGFLLEVWRGTKKTWMRGTCFNGNKVEWGSCQNG